MAAIRVMIADDHAVLRAGLRMLVNAQEDLEIVGEAANAAETLRKAKETSPDVLILDLVMPGSNGIDMIGQIRQDCPQTRVLVLTMHDDAAYLRAALAAGGSGYVVKTAADTELLSAIRAVHEGRTYVNMSLTDILIQTLVGTQPANAPANAAEPGSPLSDREREVLELAAKGHTNQEIADRLFLSVKTIETYRARLMAKLCLQSRADLVRYAASHGLLGRDSFTPRTNRTDVSGSP